MHGVTSLPPDSPTTNNQQTPNNNVVLPPKPQPPQPTSFRQKKPPMPSPPQTSRMDPEVSNFSNLFFYFLSLSLGKVNLFGCASCAYVLFFMFRWDSIS